MPHNNSKISSDMSWECKTTPIDVALLDTSLQNEGLDPYKTRFARYLKREGRLSENDAHYSSEEGFAELVKATIPERQISSFVGVRIAEGQKPRLLREEFEAYLTPVIEEYKTAEKHTPELIDYTWQKIWRAIGSAVDHTYEVPSCDRTIKELESFRAKKRRFMVLTPDEIYTPEGLARLATVLPVKIYDSIGIYKPEKITQISHNLAKGGCIDVEIDTRGDSDGYFLRYGDSEQQLASMGKAGMRLPTFLVANIFSWLLNGFYFNTVGGPYAKLIGSSSGQYMIYACSYGNGEVCVYEKGPWSHPISRVRTEGRKA